MSVSSMASTAFARRSDVEPQGQGLESLEAIDEAKGGRSESASTATSAIASIAAYIPTEVVMVYVAVLATLGVPAPGDEFLPSEGAVIGPSRTASLEVANPSLYSAAAEAADSGDNGLTFLSDMDGPLLAFLLFILLTPAVIWGIYAVKVVQSDRPPPTHPRAWPKWEMAAGTIAFVIWAAALPAAPVRDWISAELAAVIALVISMLLGVFAPLFTKSALPGAVDGGSG